MTASVVAALQIGSSPEGSVIVGPLGDVLAGPSSVPKVC
jgi:hypothetical protein